MVDDFRDQLFLNIDDDKYTPRRIHQVLAARDLVWGGSKRQERNSGRISRPSERPKRVHQKFSSLDDSRKECNDRNRQNSSILGTAIQVTEAWLNVELDRYRADPERSLPLYKTRNALEGKPFG